MTKTIIVPYDDQREPDVAQVVGAALARDLGADLVVLYDDERSVADALIAASDELPEPVLCLRTHAHSGLAAHVLGSVADEVIRRSRCDIVLLGPDFEGDFRDLRGGRLVYAYDGSPLAEAMHPVVERWAEALDFAVDIVTVVHHHGEYVDDRPATGARAGASRLAERFQDAGIPAEVHVVDGLDPAHAIDAFARDRDASLIAVATHGPSGVVRSVLGTVAVRIAREAPCPVLLRRFEQTR